VPFVVVVVIKETCPGQSDESATHTSSPRFKTQPQPFPANHLKPPVIRETNVYDKDHPESGGSNRGEGNVEMRDAGADLRRSRGRVYDTSELVEPAASHSGGTKGCAYLTYECFIRWTLYRILMLSTSWRLCHHEQLVT